ncbi:MAG TPA: hypothetical protein VJZ91_15140 [Blastocatellia bacterium]|nr:hypothetical protein [Blastocatellia bacterium]
MSKIHPVWKLALACTAIFAMAISSLPIRGFVTEAQQPANRPDALCTISSTTTLTVGNPEIRLANQMQADTETRTLAPSKGAVPFHPTMSLKAYREAKEAASRAPMVPKASLQAQPAPLASARGTGVNIEGVSQAPGELFPADTHGAAGLNDFVEVTNTKIAIFSNTTTGKGASPRKTYTLAAFFGESTQKLNDPRILYDAAAGHWVITVDVMGETENSPHYLFLAVSQSTDPIGTYCIYKMEVTPFTMEDNFDFPQLGMDANAFIITAVTGKNEQSKAVLFAVPKAALYSCAGFSVPVFTGLQPTLAPPIVLDGNPKSFLIAAPSAPNAVSALKIYALTDSGGAATLTCVSDVPVPAYNIPAMAIQPVPCGGGPNVMDTSDCRFVNASTQNGNSLWQVHTIQNGRLAVPRFYQIDTMTNTVVQFGDIAVTATSYDFNASIVATQMNDVFVTWTSVDPPAGVNAQVRFSGRRNGDPLGLISSGVALFTSPTCLKGNLDDTDMDMPRQSWGDYSSVAIDPRNNQQAWIINETIPTSTSWGTRIGKIGLTP